jgi:hypothetical protein
LPREESVFYNGERIERIKFPKFEGFGRAYEIEREIIDRKPKSLWQRMKEAFNPNHEEEPEEPLMGMDEEGETDAIIDGEDSIEEELF